MQQKSYEIWRHEENRTWKVFTQVSEDSRRTLLNTGWTPVIQRKEWSDGPQELCPEEVLRLVSKTATKLK